jgi:hypothetical protein
VHGLQLAAKAAVRAEGLPQIKHTQRLKVLTCRFAPLAGLEPAPHGLEERHHPSNWSRPGPSSQVGSGPPSDRSHPGRPCDNDRIAKRIAIVRDQPWERLRPARR